MSNAELEFSKIGYKPINESEGVNKIIQESVMKLLEIFSEQGHSGFSAPYAVSYFKRMSQFDTLDDVKKEFIKIGYKPIEECEDDMDKWIQEGVLDLTESYFDIKKVLEKPDSDKIVEYFEKLGMHEPLGPILCTDDEWSDVSSMGGMGDDDVTFQNNRCSAVFKKGKDGKPYYLDAIVWKSQNGNTFTGNSILDSKGRKMKNSQTIKLPFVPKTFYIDVIKTEWADKEETIKQKGGGWWTSVIADETQLEEVWKYYENPIIEERKNKLNKIKKI